MNLENQNIEHREAPEMRSVERQIAKIPSDVWLWASLASMGTSLFLQSQGKRDRSLFIGQWAAPFLLMGVYNRLSRMEGNASL